MKHKIPDWTPFEAVTHDARERARIVAAYGEATAAALDRTEVWRNSRFQVIVSRHVPNGFGRRVTWLSIKTLQAPRHRHDWRELQRIKNELCGPECEAVELYPAESRLHDTADQYHLFVFPAGDPLPLGFAGRFVSDGVPGPTGSQRRFEERPADAVVRHTDVTHTAWIADLMEEDPAHAPEGSPDADQGSAGRRAARSGA